jgi:putative peptidoglycan lipid II flippase
MKTSPIRIGQATTLLVLISTLGSVFAVFREALVAARLGANLEMDAYFFVYAFIVSLPYFTLDAIQKSLTPIYVHNNKESKNALLNSVTNLYLIMLSAITLLVILIARFSLSSFASGFDAQGQYLVMQLTWILSPTIVLLGLWGLFKVILEAEGLFFVSAISDTFLSFCVVGAVLLGGPHLGVYSLPLGILVSSFCQLIWVAYWLRKKGISYKFELDLHNPQLKRFLSLIYPPLFAAFLGYAIPIIDRSMVSHLPEGTISTLSYADKIIMNINGIAIVPLTRVLLPSLSQSTNSLDRAEFKEKVSGVIRILFFILIPLSMAFAALSLPLTQLLYRHGVLDMNTSFSISNIFTIFALGLMPSGIMSALEITYCSIEDTKTASFVGVGSKFIFRIFFNILLIGTFGVLGIAISRSLTFVMSSLLLFFILRRRFDGIGGNNLIRTLSKTILASIFSMAPVFLITRQLDLPNYVLIFLGGFSGFLLFLLFSWVLRIPELSFILEYLIKFKNLLHKQINLYHINNLTQKGAPEKVIQDAEKQGKKEIPCVLVLVDILGVGGTERQIIELLKGLEKNNRFRVVLGVLDRGGGREKEAVPFVEKILPVRRRARFDITPLFLLIRQIKTNKVCLIHAFGWMSCLIGLFAARWCHIPIINGSIREAPPKLNFRHKINRWCASHSNAIVSNSKAGLQAQGFANHPLAQVIHNGVDFKRFESIVAKRDGSPSLCMVANFSPKKDQHTLIRALPMIREKFPQTKLVLVGQDMGTLGENRKLVQDLGLVKTIDFITDTIHPEPYIAGSDICILISDDNTHGEGISNSILEYMAFGKPVIATYFAGNYEVITQTETGFLVPSHSPEAIVRQVIELMNSPNLAQKIGQTAQKWVKERFNLERMTSDYEALYTCLMDSRKPTKVISVYGELKPQ